MTTYREAGVDIEAGDKSVQRIKPLVRKTFTPGVLADIGAFGAFFEPDLSGLDRPVLVSSVDGVGTKVKVATKAGRYDTVGQDLVNHCVNDIATSGAIPLFFLDYYATSDLVPDQVEQVVGGFATACQENGCALIGGELAEMSDVYAPGEFDLVGAVVGVVDKDKALDGSKVEVGDVLLGLPSNGLHTNGFTLARKVLFEHFDLDDEPEQLNGQSLGEALLQVHRSYLSAIQALVGADLAHGIAHITGGGLPGNLRRVIDGSFSVDYDAWERPPIFNLIQELGSVPEEEMRKTFNLGIGLTVVISPSEVQEATRLIESTGLSPTVIGKVT